MYKIKRFLLYIFFLGILLLSSCNNRNTLIMQTPLFGIQELSQDKYQYRIGTSDKPILEGEKAGSAPEITEIGDGILRLYMGYGTNAATVQYFDIWGERSSNTVSIYSVYSDYIGQNKHLLAYFDFDKHSVVVRDIFDNAITFEIKKGGQQTVYNDLKILNEKQIYLDYSITEGAKTEIIREVIDF